MSTERTDRLNAIDSEEWQKLTEEEKHHVIHRIGTLVGTLPEELKMDNRLLNLDNVIQHLGTRLFDVRDMLDDYNVVALICASKDQRIKHKHKRSDDRCVFTFIPRQHIEKVMLENGFFENGDTKIPDEFFDSSHLPIYIAGETDEDECGFRVLKRD